MSTKGLTPSTLTRQKISISKTKDRAKIDRLVKEYIKSLSASDLPQLTECAIYAGISERTLIRYEMTTEEDSEIRSLLDFIRDQQKSRLIKKGLTGDYNGKLVMFLLERGHAMKSEPTALTQNNTFNVSPEILAEAIEITRRKPLKGK